MDSLNGDLTGMYLSRSPRLLGYNYKVTGKLVLSPLRADLFAQQWTIPIYASVIVGVWKGNIHETHYGELSVALWQRKLCKSRIWHQELRWVYAFPHPTRRSRLSTIEYLNTLFLCVLCSEPNKHTLHNLLSSWLLLLRGYHIKPMVAAEFNGGYFRSHNPLTITNRLAIMFSSDSCLVLYSSWFL